MLLLLLTLFFYLPDYVLMCCRKDPIVLPKSVSVLPPLSICLLRQIYWNVAHTY